MKRFGFTRLTCSEVGFACLALLCLGCGSPQESDRGQTASTTLDSAAHFDALIVASPNDPQLYVDRAAWHLRQARIAEGLMDLNLALEADSTFAPAWSAKADALYLTQAFEPCIEHLDACLEVAPDHVPCLLRRAEMHIHLRQYPEAFARLNDVLRTDMLNAEAYWMKGIIYKDQGNAENARSSFQTAVEVDPDFYDGYIALGLACAEANDTLAIGYYETAMRLKPRSVEARYDLAYFLQECRPLNPVYLERALDLYRSISAIDSMNAAAAFNRGYIHLEYLQQYDSAALHFTEAIDVLPYYHQAFFNRGLSHESLGLVAEAESDYRQALGLKPDFTPAAMALERVLATP